MRCEYIIRVGCIISGTVKSSIKNDAIYCTKCNTLSEI